MVACVSSFKKTAIVGSSFRLSSPSKNWAKLVVAGATTINASTAQRLPIHHFILRSFLSSAGGDQNSLEEYRILCHRMGRVNLVALLAVLSFDSLRVLRAFLWIR